MCVRLRRRTHVSLSFEGAFMGYEIINEDSWAKTQLLPHAPQLKSWLLARFSTLECADDIIQEALVRVLKERRKREIKNPKALLFSIARNLTIDHIRRGKIVQFKAYTELDGFENERSDRRPSFEMERAEDFEILKNAIKSLPKRCRRVFTLRKIYQMSHKEIADSLGISVNTVQVQITIGLAKCKGYFESFEK
jgi:RNA polymerase sigma factor (sigma-70 family)